MDREKALAIIRAARRRLGFRDLAFVKQDRFVSDKAKFLVAQCSRRAGKTTGLALRFLKTLNDHPGCFCPYIALTRESARNIMWPVLQEQNDRYGAGLTFTESNLTATHPNGARLQLFGADTKNFIRRLKGIKTPGAAIDEVNDFPPHLQSLVDDVLTPALTDYSDSWLALTGTPGPVPSGYFYEISELRQYGYSVHKWGILDNPYLPNAKDFLQSLKDRNKWGEENPTLRREWLNQWVLDLDALVFKYEAARNHYDVLPTIHGPWSYIIGVDVGFNDADAIAVIGWNDNLNCAYLVEESIQAEQGVTELARGLEQMMTKYKPIRIVMDTGGLGKKIAEEIHRRFLIPVVPAEKSRKQEFIELLNDAMRTGKFFAKATSNFAQDSMRVKWDYERSTPDRRVISNSYHSDINDAVLYAFRDSLHWTYQAPPAPPPKPGTQEWYRAEVARMEEWALHQGAEMLQREQDADCWNTYGMDQEEVIQYYVEKFKR